MQGSRYGAADAGRLIDLGSRGQEGKRRRRADRLTSPGLEGRPAGRPDSIYVSQGHGPVIANVTPVWLLTNSHLPSGLNTAPAHSFCFPLAVKLVPDGRVSVPNPAPVKSMLFRAKVKICPV